jgi:hypothetical protein
MFSTSFVRCSRCAQWTRPAPHRCINRRRLQARTSLRRASACDPAGASDCDHSRGDYHGCGAALRGRPLAIRSTGGLPARRSAPWDPVGAHRSPRRSASSTSSRRSIGARTSGVEAWRKAFLFPQEAVVTVIVLSRPTVYHPLYFSPSYSISTWTGGGGSSGL